MAMPPAFDREERKDWFCSVTQLDDHKDLRSLTDIVKNVLETNLTGREYKSDECGAMTRKIADQIRQGAKSLGYSRYKFVSLVSIGPPQPATVSISSRCVWNDKFDTYAEYVFQNSHIYAVGLVYGMYCE